MSTIDAAIVGGGIAGLIVGVRLSELGLKPVVIEAGQDTLYLCNSRFTSGAFHVAFHDPNEEAGALADAISKITHSYANSDWTAAIATNARSAIHWLAGNGIKLIKAGPEAWKRHFLAPPALQQPGLHWQGRGGDVMLRSLRARLIANGGQLRQGTRARRLMMDNGRCTGLEIDSISGLETLAANATVLCDGGFQANMSLMREFISPAPEKLMQRGAATGRGDALMMAREVGAAVVGADSFYGHLLCLDVLTKDGLWPYPVLDYIGVSAIVVDASGQRFADEGLGGVYITNKVARLSDPLSATVIFDHKIWEGPAKEFILPANPNLVKAGGTIIKAGTLEEMGLQLDLPRLASTVAAYNAAVDENATSMLHPARTAGVYTPYPIRQAPFYAVRLCPGITYTMGGLAIDKFGRVQNRGGSEIPGLYASGCTTGGLEGGEFAGYIGGLTKSAVMSLAVAAHISETRK